MKKLLIIPDVHVPFEDERATDVTLQAGEGFKPDIVVTLGDQLDLYTVSAHSKNPNRVTHLDLEIEAGNKWLSKLQKLGAKEHHFIAGNHEHRLERYLEERAPALFNSVKVSKLLKLEERGWSYTPYKKGKTIGKAYYTHDLGQAGAYAFMRARARRGGNVVIGHTHYAGVSYMGNDKGETHVGISAGWLGSRAAIDYTTAQNASEWVHSFLIGRMEPNGVTHFQLVPIVNGRCVVEGKLYK